MKRTALARGKPLERKSGLSRGNGAQDRKKTAEARRGAQTRRSAISPATAAQRKKARDQGCIVCGRAHDDFTCGPVDPAHLIDRSLLTVGQDDPLAVVGLGRRLHDLYDENGFDLLPFLERSARPELAFAVERFGLIATLRRVTNNREAGR